MANAAASPSSSSLLMPRRHANPSSAPNLYSSSFSVFLRSSSVPSLSSSSTLMENPSSIVYLSPPQTQRIAAPYALFCNGGRRGLLSACAAFGRRINPASSSSILSAEELRERMKNHHKLLASEDKEIHDRMKDYYKHMSSEEEDFDESLKSCEEDFRERGERLVQLIRQAPPAVRNRMRDSLVLHDKSKNLVKSFIRLRQCLHEKKMEQVKVEKEIIWNKWIIGAEIILAIPLLMPGQAKFLLSLPAIIGYIIIYLLIVFHE